VKTYAWDFRGPRAQAIAEHHARHLREFLDRHGLTGCQVRCEQPRPFQATALLEAPEPAWAVVEKALRPPRVV
jgi:hypothetical protein